MNSTGYINFSAYDYKGEISLSSYALPQTPFTFISELEYDVGKRVVWDFGDGTTSDDYSISAKKYYNFPGNYNVGLIVYDCNNNAIISTVSQIVTVFDYTPLTFHVEISSDLSNGSLFSIPCGKICGPLTAYSYSPIYQPHLNIYYEISGSLSDNYWDILNKKFDHLESFHTLYEKTYNYAISSYQYVEIDKLENSYEYSYAKFENGDIIECNSTDSGAFVVGKSSVKEFYIRDDTPKGQILISFFYDKRGNVINGINLNCLNNLKVTLSAEVVDNPDVDGFSVTSNGIDGEGFHIDTFDISKIKFFNTKIPFIVKIKDADGFSVKNFDKIPLSALSITVDGNYITDTQYLTYDGDFIVYDFDPIVYSTIVSTISSTDYRVYSINDTLSSQGSGGAFRGYIVFPLSSYDYLHNVSINVSGTLVSDTLSTYVLTGSSAPFDVFEKKYYDAFKINEDFNSSNVLKDLIFQETLLDKSRLFDDFFGSVLGNGGDTHEEVGSKTYEKITNFVSNTQDVETCECDHLNSLSLFCGYNDNGEEKYKYPNKLKRIVDLASLDKSKLIGESNKFNQNFDIRGRSSKETYGKNIGNRINPSTYVVSLSTPIVALEKFSNTYTLINTYQPLSVVNATHYPLSSYSDDWGWPLVLPSDFSFDHIEKYYLFFEYNGQYDDTTIGSIVNYDDSRTTIESSYTNGELFDVNGVFDNMFLDTLYQSLSLV